ncbi:MAG: GAF domain-containing protein, partial [Anaerolineae bacterium]|nr:GAF domain-containing protein [Anaerolineae bacterium]
KNINTIASSENWLAIEKCGQSGDFPIRSEFIRLDGSLVPVEITQEVQHPDGEQAVQILAVDISAHVEKEQSLISQSNYLRQLNNIAIIAAGVSSFNDMLQALAFHLGELFDADACYLTLWDEETQTTQPVAANQKMKKTNPSMDAIKGQQTMTAAVLQAENTLIAADTRNSPYIDPAIAAQFPPHTAMGLPLIVNEQKLGAAIIGFEIGHIFTDEEISRGEQVAAQIALAIARAKSFSDARESAKALSQRNSELSILYQASQVIGSALLLDDVLNEVAQILSNALLSSGCSISLWHPEEGIAETLFDFSQKFPEHTEKSGTIYRLEDYPATRQVLETGQPSSMSLNDPLLDPAERAYMQKEEITSLLMLPLITGQRILGLVEVYEETTFREYIQDEIQLAQSLCAHAAAAIENTRLLQDYQNLTDELEQRVTQRTLELELRVSEVEQLNSAMSNLLEDVQTANRILEITTLQLQEANQELESFSYSVSHDLRAPLRHINAFTQLLLDRDHEDMDKTSLRFLNNIAASSDRMSQLIDDLLKFSRTSRAEMELRAVDFNSLIEKQVEEIGFTVKDRVIDWQIGIMPVAQADPALMRVVWSNLIANAVKYTALEENARIEIGKDMDETGEFYHFYIRDNGVGFDPKYADKLFGVFQRLHQRDEFDGTGIGLATVRRVIHRHGGRVWAESELGQGATFYFSLPVEAL